MKSKEEKTHWRIRRLYHNNTGSQSFVFWDSLFYCFTMTYFYHVEPGRGDWIGCINH